MSSSVTVIDVAREARVSPSTVSRILNGTTAVAEDKRRRVLETVKRLGYKPNVLAQGLVRGKSMTIGVVIPDLSSAFYSAAIGGIEIALFNGGHGYHPLYASAHWQADEERSSIELLLARRVDGLIVMGGLSDASFLREVAQRSPLIVIGRLIEGIQNQCVVVDNVQGAFKATTHLIEFGHRRIAFVSGPNGNQDSADRLAGYRQALETYQLEFNPQLVVEGDFLEHSGSIALEALLMRGHTFSAVFCANDQMAMGVRLALARRGLRVPEDVSIVGYDDLPSSQYLYPPLTSVRQPINEISAHALGALVAQLKGGALKLETFEPRLMLRESTFRIGFDRSPRRDLGEG